MRSAVVNKPTALAIYQSYHLHMPHLDGIESAWHLQHRSIIEEAGEKFDVYSGRHEN